MKPTNISIIPQPISIKRGLGSFTILPSTFITYSAPLVEEANYLKDIIYNSTGYTFKLDVEGSGTVHHSPVIRLLKEAPIHSNGNESYQLTTEPLKVTVRGSTSHAVFNGIQSLLQLFPPAIYSKTPRVGVSWVAPCVTISDSPRFAWRGSHLDVSRHFMPKSFLFKWIDLLAIHKINIFHLHLTDDQGWRIEILKYPKLTEIGSQRKESSWGYYSYHTGDNTPHGGYYTQSDLRELVEYAKQRHITIVPEIDMPGHMQAAIAAYPQFGCTDKKLEVGTVWGIYENILNPFDHTIEFMKDILSEVIDIFPSKYIHVGGDEAIKTQWNNTPAIVEHMKKVGAADAHELQSYFIKKMDEFLIKKGRTLIGWDEILEGGISPGAAVMSWRGIDGAVSAAKQLHYAVMAPTSHTYFDYYQTYDISQEPLAIMGVLPLSKVYEFDPIPAELNETITKYILGVQGQIWTEYIPNPTQVEYMGFPRLCALSEVGWSQLKDKKWEDFLDRLRVHLKRLDILQVKYRPLDTQ